MGTEKMREEFGKWYLEEVTESYGESIRAQAQKNLDWVREDGSFADPMLRLASLAWQSSRAAIEVELPSPYPSAPPYASYEGGWNEMREEAKDAIESLGLKVKP
ncbi:hypothetical protein [Pseudomonas sp. MF7448]|uniref:hypothetical protein n=1 Tax=Pseudomonas sp. MF7448 TaxID=2797537 RepID=UPI00190AADCC|nr:hypothetical protein [Pseudomonas sp. MF7448]MBK3439309.1 hypothetical protein [Pseudomonas sp. MF7448]